MREEIANEKAQERNELLIKERPFLTREGVRCEMETVKYGHQHYWD